jgi:OPT family oligopeptide transporter
MKSDDDAPLEISVTRLARQRPAGLREFSPRAILCGLFVAALMGASYPYVVLKLGFGPNVSVVSAILGYVALGLVVTPLLGVLGVRHMPYNRWENNIVQTAGTSAAQTAFMCVLLAAFDMLAQSKSIDFKLALTPLQSFAWLTTAGLLGVLLAVPLRRHYIVDEKLPFADGLAAGETVLVCDSQGPAAVRAALAMLAGIAASALLMAMTEDSHLLKWFPSTFVVGTLLMQKMAVGVEWSLLAVGSGMLIGPRINLSMLLGAVLAWVIAPYALIQVGWLPADANRTHALFWIMWPATGMMVAGGLAALLLRWRVLLKTFRNLAPATGTAVIPPAPHPDQHAIQRQDMTTQAPPRPVTLAGVEGQPVVERQARDDEFPLRWVLVGAVLCGVALVVVQKTMLDQAVWITVAAIVLSAPLALVGLRVLGETNWGPISALSNMMQGVFALLAPGNVPANMVASGTTGTIAVESEAIMQDFKAGDMVGSSPRYLTYMQLLATPLGAAAVSWMYPLLRAQYGIGDKGLSSPISRKWAGFAEILSQGTEALPPGAMTALVIGSLVGVVLAVLEMKVKNKALVPSPTGLGIGMLVPFSVIVTMVAGGLIGWVWTRTSPRTSEALQVPLASGLIAGEALIAVVVPLLVLCRLLST